MSIRRSTSYRYVSVGREVERKSLREGGKDRESVQAANKNAGRSLARRWVVSLELQLRRYLRSLLRLDGFIDVAEADVAVEHFFPSLLAPVDDDVRIGIRLIQGRIVVRGAVRDLRAF